jgi:NAD(P)-dependent dehydrogenase (short-subunit alcohol dehydrogenase family)
LLFVASPGRQRQQQRMVRVASSLTSLFLFSSRRYHLLVVKSSSDHFSTTTSRLMSSTTSSSQKTVLITGGNRGLGKALVETFANHGWNVLATARRADTITATTPSVEAFDLDLAQHDSVMALVSKLSERPIDVIIHNAGFNPKDVKDQPGYFESTFYCKDFSAANVAESMLINALHPMELTGKLLPNNLSNVGGIVIAISSWLGSIGEKQVAGHYGYTGSKALMNMCMKGLSLEFAKDDTTNRAAIALNPGWMKTDMGGSNADITPEEVSQRILNMIEDGFFLQNNGKFLNTDRTEHAW